MENIEKKKNKIMNLNQTSYISSESLDIEIPKPNLIKKCPSQPLCKVLY